MRLSPCPPRPIFAKMHRWIALVAMAAIPIGSTAAQDPEEEDPARARARPLFELDHGRVDVRWKQEGSELFADVTLRNPTLRVIRRSESPEEDPIQPQEPPEDPGEVAREELPFPLTVDRVEIHDATIVFVDETVPGTELLQIHGLDGLIENFSTQRGRSGGLPTLLVARGRVGRDGEVAVFATLNPWSESLDFAGRAQVVGLRLEELGGFVEEGIDLQPADGRFSAFMEFSVHDQQIVGGIRPVLEDVDLVATQPGFLDRLREGTADVAFELFSDDVPEREAVVTTVPLRGRITDPQPDLWRTFTGVLRNAFIETIAVGFGGIAEDL